MGELIEVQKMLDAKNRAISQKEYELKQREKHFETLKQRALQTLREEFATQFKEHESKLTKEVNALLKKASQAERNLQNKIKLASSSSKNTSIVSEAAAKNKLKSGISVSNS